MAGLTILNTYTLRGSEADFKTAITALAARVEAEGEPGVLSYRFFVSELTSFSSGPWLCFLSQKLAR